MFVICTIKNVQINYYDYLLRTKYTFLEPICAKKMIGALKHISLDFVLIILLVIAMDCTFLDLFVKLLLMKYSIKLQK